MRGNSKLQNPLFFVANSEERLPKNHPLRSIKRRADVVLKGMERVFNDAYSQSGRPGIPLEALLKALLLQALYSIPSERRLVEAISWNLLYQGVLRPQTGCRDVGCHGLYAQSRAVRTARFGQKFFERVVATALVERCNWNDHFTVDGTLINFWASLKSFRPKDEPWSRGQVKADGIPR